MARVAINGLGRIGRATLKILRELDSVEVAAVNDLISAENLAYLLGYDSVYGRYDRTVSADGDRLIVADTPIPLYAQRDPSALPWGELGIDLVFECTGMFRREQELAGHLEAGARFVLLSAPARTETVATVVHGTNQAADSSSMVSCASCTTNCITPVVEVLQRHVGLARAMMTTVHAYTANQQLVDGPSSDFRRGRAGAANILPAATGAATATTRALPELTDRFDGVAIRAPIPVGSMADIVAVVERATSTDEINDIFRAESRTARYRGVLGVTEDPIVSTDIIGDSRASVVDTAMTRVVDNTLVKVMSWYDNEWGFSHQMVREALSLLGLDTSTV